MADLADGEHVERRLERARHLRRDFDAAAGEPDDDGVRGPLAFQRRREPPACVAAVAKERCRDHARAPPLQARAGRG
jgi:hypothetical protein